MDLLQGIRTFVRVVEHGSFTQAAQALGTSPATVSRQVAGLEQALSARLLQRNTRSVVVTESGLRYYEHCKQILRTVAAAAGGRRRQPVPRQRSPAPPRGDRTGPRAPDAATGGLPGRPSGRLRRPHAGPGHPGPARGRPGRADHPRPNLAGLDPGRPRSRPGVQRGLCRAGIPGTAWRATHAGGPAAASLPERGRAVLPAGLGLRRRTRRNAARSRRGAQGQPSRGRLRRRRAGLGVCLLPGFVAARALQEGSLLRLLPGHRLHVREVFVLYSSRRYLDAKIRTWVDFLGNACPWRSSVTGRSSTIDATGRKAQPA